MTDVYMASSPKPSFQNIGFVPPRALEAHVAVSELKGRLKATGIISVAWTCL